MAANVFESYNKGTLNSSIPNQRDQSDERRTLLWTHLALVALVLVVGWRTFGFEMLAWDDARGFYGNPHIRGFTAENLRWMFTDASYNAVYMPLGWVWIALSEKFLGMDGPPHHVLNVAIHAINAVSVFAILRELAEVLFPGSQRRWRVIATFLGAAVWAIHPLRVEAFTWIAARVHTQACLFLFPCCYFYLLAARRSALNRWMWCSPWYWVACAFYLLSILTFPTGLAIPVAFLLVDVCAAGFPAEIPAKTDLLRRLTEKVLFAIPAAVSLALSLHGQSQSSTGVIPTLAERGILARFLQACYVWMIYAVRTVYPRTLSPLYLRMTSPDRFAAVYWLSAAAVVSITVALVLFRRRFGKTLMAWAFHLVLLFPFLGLALAAPTPSDRYSYTTGIVWGAMVMGWLIGIESHRNRITATAVITMLIAGLAIGSVAQEAIWADSAKLFEHMLALPLSRDRRMEISIRLSDYEQSRSNDVRAINALDDGLEQDRDNFVLLFKKGQLLAAQADRIVPILDAHAVALRQLAAKCFIRSAEIQKNPEPLAQACIAYMKNRQWKLAVDRLHQAVELSPGSNALVLKLAEACYCNGSTRAANQFLDVLGARDASIAASRDALIRQWEAEKSAVPSP